MDRERPTFGCHLLSLFTKSYFSRTDAQNTRLEPTDSGWKEISTGTADQENGGNSRENGKKEFSVDGEAYLKFSAHIGHFPCVMIAPDDTEMITGGSEERRRFLDSTLSQLDAAYLSELIEYTKILQQRNALLKRAAETGHLDKALLDILDAQLIVPGEIIFTKRKSFLADFTDRVSKYYSARGQGRGRGNQL
jgi:DNA replication and repair protein RecF